MGVVAKVRVLQWIEQSMVQYSVLHCTILYSTLSNFSIQFQLSDFIRSDFSLIIDELWFQLMLGLMEMMGWWVDDIDVWG